MTSLVERLRAGGIEENEAADKIEQLRILVVHQRHCRTCAESDISDCHEGAMLWRISMGEL